MRMDLAPPDGSGYEPLTVSLPDPVQLAAAREAGLHYVNDNAPGYTRRRAGDWFEYFDEGGRRIDDEALVRRLDRLAIPPAYTDVWICPDARGHLQATGR